MLNEKKLFLLFPPFICRIIFGINIQFWPNALCGFNFCWAGQSVFHGAGHSIPGFHVPVIGGRLDLARLDAADCSLDVEAINPYDC